MIIKRYVILLFMLSTGSVLVAMDGQSISTIDFKNKTKEELNTFALEKDVDCLTPRSKQSLEARIKELGITQKSGDFIYTALASDGSRNAYIQDIDAFITAQFNCWNNRKKSTHDSEQK